MISHHLVAPLIALGVLVVVALVVRIVIGDPRAARHRTRLLRWRTRLYLRPGPGHANMLEVAARWSRLRAVRAGGRARPSLPWWARLILPVTSYAVRLGRAHLGHRVIASMEDQILVLAAPRTGKSGWLADRIIDHPGAVLTTTTRSDLLENTAPLRGQRGDVHVFNPEGIGGFASTFRWNPLAGCEQPAVALRRAIAFTAATESRSLHDMAFWVGKASAALACLLHAAALSQATMSDVYRWAHDVGDTAPEQIPATYHGAAQGWLGPVQEIRRPGRTADSIRMTMTRALAWLADPDVAAATTPGPGAGFDVAAFVAGPNTLYMIGSGREDAPIAPLFRAFTEYVHDGAAFTGSLQPHHRLDAPLLLALDEVTQICPVPLPQRMADSAGKGISIVAVCHGLAQLEARWDSSGARAIWDTAGIKVILGGVSDADTLDMVSQLCGEIELRTYSWTRDEYGRRARMVSYQPVQVVPPELLRTLPDWRALVVPGNLSPVIIKLRMAWRRHDYRRARRLGPAAWQGRPTLSPGRSRQAWPWAISADDIASLADDPGLSDDDPATRQEDGWTQPTPGWPAPPAQPATPTPTVGSARRSGRLTMTDHTQGRDEPPSAAALAIHVNALRREVKSLTAKLDAVTSTQEDHAPAAWFWLTMSERERDDKLAELTDWVEIVLREQYPDYLASQLRPCWPHHPEARWELAWLYQLWSLTYLAKNAGLKDAADWHDRWLPGTLRRLSAIMASCDRSCRKQRIPVVNQQF